MNNPLATFTYDSHDIRSVKFTSQQKEERIKLFLRHHWVTNVGWMLTTLFLLIPALCVFLFRDRIADLISNNILPSLFTETEIILIAAIYTLAVSYYALLNFLRWYFNVLIVTNQRAIDLALIPPFNWQITQAQLEEVQDVRHTQGGLLGIIFNMGHIYIQTAGTSQNIAIRNIPKPSRAHELIIQLLP